MLCECEGVMVSEDNSFASYVALTTVLEARLS